MRGMTALPVCRVVGSINRTVATKPRVCVRTMMEKGTASSVAASSVGLCSLSGIESASETAMLRATTASSSQSIV
ncbi:hypothetical protein FHU13_005050 [Methylobacterium sp. R2-1]|nr:hypothetical protein [Methylobacterium sp. R2-1]